jgi:hypothetical protein
MDDLEQRRKRIETLVKLAATGVVGFLVAPFIFIAIKGIVGLIIAAAVSFITIQFIPFFALKIANWRLRAIKWEAGRNPIETLQNDYGKRLEALKTFRDRIRTSAAAISSFGAKLNEFKANRPDRAAKFQEEYDKMLQVLEARREKYGRAKQSLEAYSKRIDAAKDEWDMAQAAIAMNKAVGTIDGEEFLQKIMVSTAMDSVQKALSESFADLELSLMDEAAGKMPAAQIDKASVAALPAPSDDALDLAVNVTPSGIVDPVKPRATSRKGC